MLKVSSIRTTILATSLMAGISCVAQNKPQKGTDELIIKEFRKADSTPQDFYVSQSELNTYIGNPEKKVVDFDTNKDNRLNIDEFASIIMQQSITPHEKAQEAQKEVISVIQKPEIAQTQQKLKSQFQLNLEAYKITKEINYYTKNKTKTITKPGLLWGTNTYKIYDEDKIIAAIKQINKDNIFAVVNKFYYGNPTSETKHQQNLSDICTQCDKAIGDNKQVIYEYLYSVLLEAANEKDLGTEVKKILQSNGNKKQKIDDAFNLIAGR